MNIDECKDKTRTRIWLAKFQFMAGKGSNRRKENTKLIHENWDAINWGKSKKNFREDTGDAKWAVTQRNDVPPWAGSTISGLRKAAREFNELNGEALLKASQG